MSTYVPVAVRRHWTRVARLGCVLCGGPAEIAHCHGGSVRERLQEPKAKGKKLARLHYLVLPLCPPHGREPYPLALDTDCDLVQVVRLRAVALFPCGDLWDRHLASKLPVYLARVSAPHASTAPPPLTILGA